jgi:hypothetical protein
MPGRRTRRGGEGGGQAARGRDVPDRDRELRDRAPRLRVARCARDCMSLSRCRKAYAPARTAPGDNQALRQQGDRELIDAMEKEGILNQEGKSHRYETRRRGR